MKVVLVYISPNRTTQMITAELIKLFSKDMHEVVELNLGKSANRDFKSIDAKLFEDAGLIGFGSPVYHLRALQPLTDFIKILIPEIKRLNPDIRAFIYFTYGGISTEKAFINTAKLLKQNDIKLIGGFKVVAPHFWHVENYPDETSVKIVSEFFSAISQKEFGEVEWHRVDKMFKIQKPIVRLVYPLTETIGRLRQRQVVFDHTKCIKCKRCTNECPVNAITMNGYPERDKNKCIYCYHCTTVCSKNAVLFNVCDIQRMLEKNKKIIGMEKPENEIYY